MSLLETVCMKCQILFSRKYKKNIINLSSAELVQKVVKGSYFGLVLRSFVCSLSPRAIFTDFEWANFYNFWNFIFIYLSSHTSSLMYDSDSRIVNGVLAHKREANAQISLKNMQSDQSLYYSRHARKAKAQIRLRGCAVWFGPSLSAARIIGYYGERISGWHLAHAQDDVNPHILRMLEGTFSLDAAHITRLNIGTIIISSLGVQIFRVNTV